MSDIIESFGFGEHVYNRKFNCKPEVAYFKNTDRAIRKIKEHLDKDSSMAIHADIDMDGVGSAFIFRTFTLRMNKVQKCLPMINKDRTHGITEKYVEPLHSMGVEFLVVLDSSTNDLDVLKKFKCDVLVVDHHIVEGDVHTSESSMCYNTDDGHEIIIVNNTIDNLEPSVECWVNEGIDKNSLGWIVPYKADSKMSCGVVLYELLRSYFYMYGDINRLEEMGLNQWAAVTLYSDMIELNTKRNQWYVKNTVFTKEVETHLFKLLNTLSLYNKGPDKSNINYTLSPLINRSVRVGKSNRALSIVLSEQSKVKELQAYAEEEKAIVDKASSHYDEYDTYVLKNLDEDNVGNGFGGVIAMAIVSKTGKPCIAYTVENGVVSGHFRGTQYNKDYKKIMADAGCVTKGHRGAFGAEGSLEDIKNGLKNCSYAGEDEAGNEIFAGVPTDKGIYVPNLQELKVHGDLDKIGIANACLSSGEEIKIIVPIASVKLLETRGKLYTYSVDGITSKAFEEITTPKVIAYPEYGRYGDNVTIYLRNYGR